MAQSALIERQLSETLDYLLEEFEGQLSNIHRRKEIQFGYANQEPAVIEHFKKEVKIKSYS
jgi:hypothetical protein